MSFNPFGKIYKFQAKMSFSPPAKVQSGTQGATGNVRKLAQQAGVGEGGSLYTFVPQ